MTPKGYERLIAELPASERATLAWATQAITLALERLYEAPALSTDILSEATASFLDKVRSLPRALEGLYGAGGREEFLRRMLPVFKQYYESLVALPIERRRPAARALATSLVLGGIGAHVIGTGVTLDRIAQGLEEAPALLGNELFAGAKAAVAVMAVLHGIETERERAPRLFELIAMAHAEAQRFAAVLAAIKPDDPQMRLPWYFESGEDAQKFRWFATWAERETSRNDRAFTLVESWAREPGVPDAREEWEQLKRELDRDRPSDRPLFP